MPLRQEESSGKSSLTAPRSSSAPPAVGKTSLTSMVQPIAPRANVDEASQDLQDAQARVEQARQHVVAVRARAGSASSSSESGSEGEGEMSIEEIDRYLQEVQIFQARVVQLQTARATLVTRQPRPTSPMTATPRASTDSAAASSSAASSSAAEDSDRAAPYEQPAVAAFDYDWLKRAAKASSYGLALAGAAASLLGWSALYHVPKVQQLGQASGSIGKNFAGAVGDYGDYRDKARKGENTDGLLLKSGGQAISGVGQVLNLAGIVATNGGVVRATGAFVNALGMVVVGVGELQPPGEKKNVAKAATNFVAAVFAALAGVGFSVNEAAVGKVMEEVARSFDAAGAASSAFTPFGGAVDDAKNSKAAGDTKRQRLMNDPKPGGQAISAIGGVMNTAALIVNKVADTGATPDDVMKMRVAARVLGSVGSLIMSVGNGFTAAGEWRPAKAPAQPDAEQGIAMLAR